MTHPNDEHLPDGLREVAQELRNQRVEASALELDQIKRTAMTQASRASGSRQGKGSLMRSKLLTLALVLGLASSGGVAGVIAAGNGGGDGGKSSAAKSEYKPGKGCGDKDGQRTGPPGNPDNNDCPPQTPRP